jgi:predicted lipase
MACIAKYKHVPSMCVDATIRKSNAQVVLMWSKDEKPRQHLLVAFKGTTNSQDILSFFRVTPEEFRFREFSMKVHSGILGMFEHLENDLSKVLPIANLPDSSDFQVTFTGHSLGGSIAMLASAYYGCMSNRNLRVTCHTFGSPRVGDQAFHEWCKANVVEFVNVVNHRDIVPKLPFGFGYRANPDQFHLENLSSKCKNTIESHDLDAYVTNLSLAIEDMGSAPKKFI